MAGVEVLGAISSALQLAECVIKIINAFSEALDTVKSASKVLQGKSDQLIRLKLAALAVQENRQLHTKLIQSHLEATIAKADVLHTVVKSTIVEHTEGSFQRRFWKAFRKAGEKALLEAFENLETEKISLLLCIQIASAETLSKIDRGMANIRETSNGSIVGVQEKNGGMHSGEVWHIDLQLEMI